MVIVMKSNPSIENLSKDQLDYIKAKIDVGGTT